MKRARQLLIANRHRGLRIDRRAIAKTIATLDAHADAFQGGCPPGELSLVFLTDAALAALHAGFLADPSITDVITFPAQTTNGYSADAMEAIAGEICVSADAARRHVTTGEPTRTRARFAERFSEELTLYLVHGWLHLAGYDDLEPAKKRTMRRAEARAMRRLRAAGALPKFTVTPG